MAITQANIWDALRAHSNGGHTQRERERERENENGARGNPKRSMDRTGGLQIELLCGIVR